VAAEEPSVVVVAEEPWAAEVAREAMPHPAAVMVTAVTDIAVAMDSVAAMDTAVGAGAVGAWASVTGPGTTATDTDTILTLTGILTRVIPTHTTHRITEIQRHTEIQSHMDIRLRTDILPPTDTIRTRTVIPVPGLEW